MFRSLAPTAPAMPQGLTMLGERPPRVWCNWDSALEFHSLVGRDRCEADSELVWADQAVDNPLTLEVLNAVDVVPKSEEEFVPEQSHGELAKNDSLHQKSGDLFVTCKVNAISATRKQGHFVVEVHRSDSGACMQVVATRADVAVGQVWVIALPG